MDEAVGQWLQNAAGQPCTPLWVYNDENVQDTRAVPRSVCDFIPRCSLTECSSMSETASGGRNSDCSDHTWNPVSKSFLFFPPSSSWPFAYTKWLINMETIHVIKFGFLQPPPVSVVASKGLRGRLLTGAKFLFFSFWPFKGDDKTGSALWTALY